MKRCPSCQSAFPTNYTHCPRDGSALAEAGEWAEGTIVRGKYQILSKVGQGGMASVYKALHVRFKELRALKVMSPELTGDPTFVKRFEQEAIVTRSLQHPNAVRVEDIDEAEDGRPFIVMEYVEGGNLKDVIEQEAPMPVARVCSIVKQVAAALDAAHGLGLVHRDIKPANIALIASRDRAGRLSDRVKVLDFGIAKLKEAHLEDSKAHPLAHMTLTGTGIVIGTPAYMSPEQAKGLKGGQLDGRSDLYSLGVVMYQMLTGDFPLKADSTLELLMAHVSTPPKPIHEVRPDLNIPDSVAGVVMRCLEKNRELRPASGQALIDDLRLAESTGGREQPESSAAPTRFATRVDEAQASALTAASTAVRLRSGLCIVVAIVIVVAIGSGWYLRKQQAPAAREDRAVIPAISNSSQGSFSVGRSPGLSSTTNGSSADVTSPAPPAQLPARPAPTKSGSSFTAPDSSSVLEAIKSRATGPKELTSRSVAPATPALGSTGKSNHTGSTAPAPAPPSAVLAIETLPSGVSVWVDGEYRGVTSTDGRLKVVGLPLGRHNVKFFHWGYEDHDEDMVLGAGQNEKLLMLTALKAAPTTTSAQNIVNEVSVGPASLTATSPNPPAATSTNSAIENGPVPDWTRQFDVAHVHAFAPRDGFGKISVRDGQIAYSENGNTKHDFAISCSQLKEAWTDGGSIVRIAFPGKKYAFLPGRQGDPVTQMKQQEILQAVSRACPTFRVRFWP
jgi:serine/threonine protein kinase